jgi:hypothetical protein
MKLQQSFAAMVLLAAIAGHAEASSAPASSSSVHTASPPAAAATQSASQNAAQAEGAVEDAQTKARASAWFAYRRSVIDALSASPDPRDWALAALLPDHDGDGTNLHPHASALLDRALPLAGDDRLVLWIATVQNTDGKSAAHLTALQRLRDIEPENAAVWIVVLDDATARKDDDAIGAALRRMADARRFDTRTAQLAKAVTDVFRRYPVSPELIESLSDRESKPTSEAIAVTTALAVTGAVGMPGFQHLVNACQVVAAGAKNISRRDDCGAAGRLLMLHSDTLVASRIGMAVLRVSKTYESADLEAARSNDWIYDQYLSTVPTEENEQALAWATAYQRDWIETGSELEAMRRAMTRAGIALAPPDNWTDTKSVFTEERLRAEQLPAAKQAATSD